MDASGRNFVQVDGEGCHYQLKVECGSVYDHGVGYS